MSHRFSFSAGALVAAAALMAWNKAALAVEAGGEVPEGFDASAGPALVETLERHIPPELPEPDRGPWLGAICAQTDPDTWAKVQENARQHEQARRAAAEKRRQIAEAIAEHVGVEVLIVQMFGSLGEIGVAPGETEAVEVPGIGTVHVWGLDKIRASIPGEG